MKKYMVPSLGGLAIVAAGAFLSPLSAVASEPYVPVNPCTQSCTTATVSVPDDPTSGLADTGSNISMALLGGAGAAVVIGGVVVVAVRRRARHSE